MLAWYLSAALATPLLLAQTRVTIRPLDFQNQEAAWSLVSRIDQIATRDDRIFIRSENPYLIEIDRGGQLLGKVGPAGFGTESFQTMASFALWHDRVAVLNPQFGVFLYRDGAMTDHFPSELHHGRPLTYTGMAEPFGFSGDRIVLPLPPGQDHLAVVLDGRGKELSRMGEPVKFPYEALARSSRLNDTLWTWDGAHWFSLHKYKPLIRKYGRDFQLMAEFHPNGDEISHCEARLYLPKEMPGKRFKRLPPHFSDFKAHGGHLYLLCLGALYEIDGVGGHTRNIFHFYGEGEDFADVPPGKRITLMSFAFLTDGMLVLSHPAQMWNHDLWLADLGSQRIQITKTE